VYTHTHTHTHTHVYIYRLGTGMVEANELLNSYNSILLSICLYTEV